MKKILCIIITSIIFLSTPNINAQICEGIAANGFWKSEIIEDGEPYFNNYCDETTTSTTNGRMILTETITAPIITTPLQFRVNLNHVEFFFNEVEIFVSSNGGPLTQINTGYTPTDVFGRRNARYSSVFTFTAEIFNIEFRMHPDVIPFGNEALLFDFTFEVFDENSMTWVECPDLYQGYDKNDQFNQAITDYDYDEVVEPNNTMISTGAIVTGGATGIATNIRVETDLIVDQDLILDGANNVNNESRITMMPNAQIVVTNNSTLTLRNRKVRGCDDPWESIIVENGSKLIVDENVTFDNAISAIMLEPGATLQLGGTLEAGANPKTEFTNCTNGILSIDDGSALAVNIEMEDATFKNCDYGMLLEGNTLISLFENNTFDNCKKGIRLFNGNPNIVNLSPTNPDNKNLFDSCSRGVEISNANASVRNNIFLNCSNAALVHNSDASYFERNEVEYKSIGFWGVNSRFRVFDNSFTYTNPIPYFDIASILTSGGCNNSEIDLNTISAAIRGIKTTGGVDFSISNNSIEINGPNSNSKGAGIEMFSSDLDVFGNTMELTHADGITISGSMADKNLEQSIGHNTINSLDGFKKSGIRIDGSTDFTLKYNLICGDFADGIRILNSGHNTYECNDITTNVRGIFVANNSTFQEILGNTTASYSSVHAGKNNILLRSEIGLQEHHSNLFLGDNNESECATDLAQSWVRANGLSNSDFIYDPNINSDQTPLLPQNQSPSGLFIPQIALPGQRFICDEGAAGAFVKGPFVESDVLCEYLDGLSSIQDSDPNKYWINIHHLYKSYLWFSDYSSWPTCLQEQWESETSCGVKDFALAETKLFSARRGVDNGSEEAAIVTELDGALDEEADLETVSELLNVLAELRDQRLSNVDMEYDNQLSMIESLDCDGDLQSQWKSTYLLMLQYLKNEEELSEENISEIQYTASLCAKDYGESVHWARGMLAESDPTIYDNIDQCESDFESLVLGTNEEIAYEIIDVFPNPTSDYLNITVDYVGELDYEIVDITGKLIEKFSAPSQTKVDVSKYNSGLYLIYVSDKDNNKSASKFVIK